MSDKKVKPETEQKEENPQAEAAPEKKEESAQPEAKPEEKKEIINSEIIGKKVFFLNPSVNIQNQIMDELSQHEYEVYSVRNFAHLTRVLKKYIDSVVYINLDDTQKAEAEKWIDMISAAVPDVRVGIFSSSADETLKDKYVKKPKVTCGFVNIRFDMKKTVQQIIKILESMNVKGRRKYLRASIENEETATINMSQGSGSFVNGVIRDISVVGFSCTFESDPALIKNTLYKDIQIRLHTMLIKVEAIVFGSRTENDKKVYVLLFSQRTDPDVSVKVRKYVRQNLQHKMETYYK